MAERRPRDGARVLDILDLADRAVTAAVTPITSRENVTREQWRALTFLDAGADHAAGEIPGHTMREIAARAGVPAPTATRMVARLVADGLAYRRSAPADRRRVLVHISPEGHALVERVSTALDEVMGTAMIELDPTDRLDVLDLLHRLADGADGSPAGAPSRSSPAARGSASTS